jgi:hypothetical protein
VAVRSTAGSVTSTRSHKSVRGLSATTASIRSGWGISGVSESAGGISDDNSSARPLGVHAERKDSADVKSKRPPGEKSKSTVKRFLCALHFLFANITHMHALLQDAEVLACSIVECLSLELLANRNGWVRTHE